METEADTAEKLTEEVKKVEDEKKVVLKGGDEIPLLMRKNEHTLVIDAKFYENAARIVLAGLHVEIKGFVDKEKNEVETSPGASAVKKKIEIEEANQMCKEVEIIESQMNVVKEGSEAEVEKKEKKV